MPRLIVETHCITKFPKEKKLLWYFNVTVPDPPMNLKTTEISSTSVILQWDIPWIFNGVIKMFNINIEEISSLDMNTCCVSITPIEIPINEELPTYNYTVKKIIIHKN